MWVRDPSYALNEIIAEMECWGIQYYPSSCKKNPQNVETFDRD